MALQLTLKTATSFPVEFPQAQLDALRRRLVQTQWPDEPAGGGWGYGTDVAFMKDLTAYWVDGFDWRAQERRINRFAQYRAQVDGRAIHFVYQRVRPETQTATSRARVALFLCQLPGHH